MINRLTLFHSATLSIVAYLAYFHDAISLLWRLEQTKVSFIIVAIYVACSLYLLVKREGANFKLIRYYGERLPLIGLAGTVIATMFIFNHGGDISSFKANLFAEMAPVFLTTIFGIVGALLIDMQLGLCAKDYGDGE